MNAWAWLAACAFGMLLWTWFLYPLAVVLASRFAPARPAALLSATPSVSAILAARADVEAIVERVEDFLAADYPRDRLQVVVGVDGASDATLAEIRAACERYPVVVVPADSEGGKAAGLNAAVREATGDVLVFSDVQQRFDRDALRLLAGRLAADPRLGAIGGALQLPGDRPGAGSRSPVEWYWLLERLLRAAEARLHSSVGISGSIYAMWRRDWLPMPAHLILDDVWLPMRLVLAGRRVGYDMTARAWDARSTTLAQEKVRKVRTLTGNFQLMAWLPAILVPIRNPIWLQFISHKVLRLMTPWLVFALIAGSCGLVMEAVPTEQMRALLAGIAVATAVVLLTPRTRYIAMRAAAWGWSLQTAVVEATANALRGRWNVWR